MLELCRHRGRGAAQRRGGRKEAERCRENPGRSLVKEEAESERTKSVGSLFFIHPPRNRKRSTFGCISFGNEPNWHLESKSSKSLYKDVSYKMYRKSSQKKKPNKQTIQQKESRDGVKPQLPRPSPALEGRSSIQTTRSKHKIHYTIYTTVERSASPLV